MTIKEKLQSLSEKEIRMLLCFIEAKYESTLNSMPDRFESLKEITEKSDNGDIAYMESVIETIDLYCDAILDIVVDNLPELPEAPSKEELETYLASRKEYVAAMSTDHPAATYWDEECEWVAEYINEKSN